MAEEKTEDTKIEKPVKKRTVLEKILLVVISLLSIALIAVMILKEKYPQVLERICLPGLKKQCLPHDHTSSKGCTTCGIGGGFR